MLDFNKYVDRHGEFWVQGIIEQIERVEGICATANVTLEYRWQALCLAMILPTSK